MSAIEDRERAVIIDLSRAVSSADAVKTLERTLEQSNRQWSPGSLIDINTGELLLTPGVLSKIKAVIKRFGIVIETLYSDVPQTQQSALDEGLLVRRTPPTQKFNTAHFVANAYKDLELPFETIQPGAGSPKVDSSLSVTLDDGTREEIDTRAIQGQNTLFYKQTLRSGQVLQASGNIVIIGDAHSGSEILADGDILIWGFLGGIAHAGRSGNEKAEIRAVRIEAVQLRIAHHIARRPDRLFKQQQKHRGAEIAKVKDGEIQIFEELNMN